MKKKNATVVCPNCKTTLQIEDLVLNQFSDSILSDMKNELQKRNSELLSERKRLDSLSRSFEKERKEFSKVMTKHVKEQVQLKEEILRNQFNKENDERMKVMSKKLQDKLELESSLKLQEKELVIETLRTKLLDASKSITQNMNSQQNTGEAQEIILENRIQELFANDIIEPIKKGKNGGDCLQKIMIKDRCFGTILYESKRTSRFSMDYLKKLKDDGRKANALVLVTQALPKGFEGDFNLIDGVWVTTLQGESLRNLITILRWGLIKVHSAVELHQGKEDKLNQLFDFISSEHFKSIYEQIITGIKSIEELGQIEQERFQALHVKREKYLKTLLNNAINLYASIQGLTGSVGDDLLDYQSAS